MNTITVPMEKITPAGRSATEDIVAVEAQYQVVLAGQPVFSFTCTPAALEEMTLGALYSRGYLHRGDQIRDIQVQGENICVCLVPLPESPPRPRQRTQPLEASLLAIADGLFREEDTLFFRTGCAHSCSLVSLSQEVLCSFEDIGRHNALDKVIGWALKQAFPMSQCWLVTSGRVSGDYMAKAIHAGFAGVLSRAAVTSQAVCLAKSHGVPLYGFVRGGKGNRYFP